MIHEAKLAMKGQKFIFVLLIVSLVTRVLVAPLYLEAPEVPHDFSYYIFAGQTFLEGKPLYSAEYRPGKPLEYGPLFALSMAAWIAVFGTDYLILKFPTIILDLLLMLLVFGVLKRLSNNEIAKFGSLWFTFSYLPLQSSGVLGNYDDVAVTFFMLLAIFFLLSKRPHIVLSAFSLTIGIGIKLTPIILIPPIFIYLYKTYTIRKAIVYTVVLGLTWLMMMIPFILSAGPAALHQYYYASKFMINPWFGGGISLYSFLSYLLFQFSSLFGIEATGDIFAKGNSILGNLMLCYQLGGLSLLLYILKHNVLTNKNVELVRNAFIFTWALPVFSRIFYTPYLYWIFPFVTIFLVYENRREYTKFHLSKKQIIGFLMVFLYIFTYSLLYRFWVVKDPLHKLILFSGALGVGTGTYLTMEGMKPIVKVGWSLSILAAALFEVYNAQLFGKIAWRTVAFVMGLFLSNLPKHIVEAQSHYVYMIEQITYPILLLIGLAMVFIGVQFQPAVHQEDCDKCIGNCAREG